MNRLQQGLVEDRLEILTQELTQITNFSTLKFERMDLDNKRLRNEMLNVQNKLNSANSTVRDLKNSQKDLASNSSMYAETLNESSIDQRES